MENGTRCCALNEFVRSVKKKSSPVFEAPSVFSVTSMALYCSSGMSIPARYTYGSYVSVTRTDIVPFS